MSLIPRNSIHELENFFDHAWLPFRQDGGRFGTLAPKVDLRERSDAFEISLELPGIKKENVAITLHNGILTVEAENKEENVEKNDRVLRQERHYGKYVRSFELGPQVQENNVSAKFDNGILTLIAPKLSEIPPSSRRIEIL